MGNLNIIDHASIIPYYKHHEIVKCIQDIKGSDVLCGSKQCFRQILLVVSRALLAAVIDTCLKWPDIWHHFLQMRISRNMRANDNEQEISRWLLQFGNDNRSSALNDVPSDSIDIHAAWVFNSSTVVERFQKC